MWYYLALLAGAQSSECPGYACLPGSMSLPSNQCLMAANSTVYLQPCSDSQVCDFITGLCIDPEPDDPTEAFAGEPCPSSNLCINSTCIEDYCVGGQLNSTCSSNTECDPGLYCSLGHCLPQLESGAMLCFSDFDCVNSAGCNGGTCTDYFSLPSGKEVEGCDDGFTFHNLCNSFACYKGKCVGLVHSSHSMPVSCETDFDCPGKTATGKTTYYSECQCGFSQTGAGFCSLFPGDPDVRNAKLCLKNWLFGEMSRQCNTERRFADYCIKSFWDTPNYEELTVYIYRANFYPKLQDNDDCVKEMMTDFYWDFIADHDDWGSMLAWTGAVAVVVGS